MSHSDNNSGGKDLNSGIEIRHNSALFGINLVHVIEKIFENKKINK